MPTFCQRSLFLLPLLAVLSCTQPETPTRPAATAPPAATLPAAADLPPAATVPPPASVPPAADQRPIIVVFGDSLSAGYGANNGESFPDFLQKLLDQKGFKYRVVNQGISGDTTMGGRFRIQAAVDLKPAIVILELGGNDGLRGLPLKQSKENLDLMAAAFTKAGAKLLIAGITLPPNYGPEYIRDFERMYTSTAAKYRAPLIPFLLETVIALPGAMQADGIHPTAKGNKLVADYVFRSLEPLLRR